MRTKVWLAATAAAVGLLGANMAQAATWLTDNGLTGDNQLKAQADLTLSGGVLTVVLTNLLANNQLRSAGQAVSGIEVTFEDPFTLPSVTSATGDIVNFNNTATPTPTGGTDITNRWHVALDGSALNLTAIGGGQPTELILNTSSSYGHTNASVQNQHNPYVMGPGTFVLDFGAGPVPEIASLKFEFGTGPDTLQSGSCTGDCLLHHTTIPTPEPATWAMMLLGFFGAGALLRRRRPVAA